MAAKTTTQAGNRETGSTWTGGVAPVAGDTETYSHSVTVTANGEAGSSPSTGGTAAAAFAYVGGRTLTINPNVAFTLKGDLNAWADYLLTNSIVIGAGASLIWLPPSGQQYKVAMTETVHWSCNGTSGSHVTIDTDKSLGGLAAYFEEGGINRNGGITTATFTDFIDLGTSTKFGVISLARSSGTSPQAISITNVTLTRASYFLAQAGTWSQDYTFQSNKFYDSIATTYGDNSFCALFSFDDSGSAGTWLIDSNSFDGKVAIPKFPTRLTVSNNVFLSSLFASTGSDWASDDRFHSNVIFNPSDDLQTSTRGPQRDCLYIKPGDIANPHFISVDNTSRDLSFTGLIFWVAGDNAGGEGDGIAPPAGSSNLVVSGCLVLPDGVGKTSACLVTAESSGSTVIQYAEHNTMVATGGECGLMRQNHLGGSFAGQIASCRSNLLVSYGTTTGCKAISDSGGGVDGAVNAVVDAGFNGFYNPTLNCTCKYNSTTVQATVTGYSRVRISANTPFPNSQVGHDDVVVTSDPIVDSTYTPNDWGLENGGTGVLDNTLDIVFEDPSLIIAAGDSALIPRLRAKWSVTGAAGLQLKDAAHEGVGYTIGMGEYVAASGGRRNRMNTLLRP